MKMQLMLYAFAVAFFAGCGAGNNEMPPVADALEKAEVSTNQPKTQTDDVTEAELTATVWIVVDGMTKVQGIT